MKDWIDLTAQVQRHRDRGLELGEVTASQFAMFLYASNYYRLSGYARCLYEADTWPERYRAGTTAATLMEVYDLDRAVRNAVLDGVSVVEPTLRSRVAYHLTQVIGGGDDYLREDLFLPEASPPRATDAAYGRWVKQLKNRKIVLEELGRVQGRNEIFIQHHIDRGDPIPFWAAVEVISIGTFSRLLRGLRDKSVLEPVARSVGIEDVPKLLQAVQNVAFIRNIAAHHGRLWHRRFDGSVTLPEIALRIKRAYLSPKTPAAAFTLLAGLVDRIEGDSSYSSHLLDLIHSVPGLEDGYYRPIL
ncbi:Abi family protein [Leifsonia shinshuensis]|uniref:Abi family protein n=1 Tax=Leifsonia shinshuensis TaxID=150026 RepID=UPI002855D2FC|nr:Abi family protein [Leifsonia shinshuensis]MDR6972135.1 abortive infection bacteriophage resistance protein [Leifsonia shinshuensis]